MAWDDSKKAHAIKAYQDAEPTAETSVEIVETIASEMGESVNGVRQILSKAGVYITKKPATKAAEGGASGGKTGGTRVSKEAQHSRLVAAIEAKGQTVDSEIVSKLTGKAAQHFAEIIENI